MFVGLDSATPPTMGRVQAARAAGIRQWNGYIATKPDVNLAHAWTQADFDVARQMGVRPIAYASGWDDPVALRELASLWDVWLCLDVENGIRPYGAWVQGWLDMSGAGVYGNLWLHASTTAAFHILAEYLGRDPQATWVTPRPDTACGWQWQGTHSEFDQNVDRGWYDEWFGGPPMPLTLQQTRQAAREALWRTSPNEPTEAELTAVAARITEDNVDTIMGETADAHPGWQAQLAGLPTRVENLETAVGQLAMRATNTTSSGLSTVVYQPVPTPPQTMPTSALTQIASGLQNVWAGISRGEVVLTSLAALIPQLQANGGSLSHLSADQISAAVVAVFTAFEALSKKK